MLGRWRKSRSKVLTQRILRHVISQSKSRGPYAESSLISSGRRRRCQHVHQHSEAIVYRTIDIGFQSAAPLLALHPWAINVVAPRPNQSQFNMAPLSFLFDSKKTAVIIPNSSILARDLEKAELVLIQRLFERQSVETRGRLPKEGTVTNPIPLVIFEWPASKSELGRH